MKSKIARCPQCGTNQTFDLSRSCGAWLCDQCDWHLGLVRCFCGWAADGGNGRQQLEECGEVIDEEGYY